MNSFIQRAARLLPGALRRSLKQALERRLQVPSMQWSLENMRRLGFAPKLILDLGAFEGEWAALAHAVFPEASMLLVEAQENKRSRLEEIVRAHGPGWLYQIALLGPREGVETPFNLYENAPTASSVLSDQRASPSRVLTLRMRTLDRLLAELDFPPPDLIKLDVQGYELEILRGGPQALASAQAVLMEVSLVEFYRGSPLLHDVTAFMHQHGYRAYDICSLVRRPLDQALAQVDMIFLKADSPLWGDRVWGG